MTWTEDQLVARLVETYGRHEREADPDVARRLAVTARSAPRRRWPVLAAVAAVVLVVAGLGVVAAHRLPEPTEPAVTPAPVITDHNRELALAVARHTLAGVPVPPGAARTTPARWDGLREPACHCGEVDPTLTRTRWWVVPQSFREVVAWYAVHTPADTAGTRYSDHTLAPRGEMAWQVAATSPAYSSPYVVIGYTRLGPHRTGLRVDVTLAARYDRTPATRVPLSVTRVEVDPWHLSGGARGPARSLTDPAVVHDVVQAFDGLAGWYADLDKVGCASPVGSVVLYEITFHWPGHVLRSDPGNPWCQIGRGLTLDGTRLPTTLDNESDDLDRAVSAAIRDR